VLLICCFKPTGNSSVGQGGIEELENVLIFGALQISALCLRFYPIHSPPKLFFLSHFCAGAKNLALFTDWPKFFYSKGYTKNFQPHTLIETRILENKFSEILVKTIKNKK